MNGPFLADGELFMLIRGTLPTGIEVGGFKMRVGDHLPAGCAIFVSDNNECFMMKNIVREGHKIGDDE